MSGISGYSEVAAQLPDEALLGRVIWFEINQADVKLEEAREQIESLGLTSEFLPKRIRPVDAFKKVSNTLAAKNIRLGDGVVTNFLVRQVGGDDATSHRHVVRERVQVKSGERRKLLYDVVAQLIYYRGTRETGYTHVTDDSIEIVDMDLQVPLHPQEEAFLDTRLNELEKSFDHMCHYMDSHQVRKCVVGFLGHLEGVQVRSSGGVYFVPQMHIDVLSRVAEWVRSIGSTFNMIPLLDLADQREMVLDALTRQTIDQVESMMREVGQILEDPNRRIAEKTFEAYTERAADLIARTNHYSKFLEAKAEDAVDYLDMFRMKLHDLATRVQDGSSQPRMRKAS